MRRVGAREPLVSAALLMVTAVLLLAGCSSNTEPQDVTVKLFVDSNANHAWDESDVPLPAVVVYLDNELSAITDAEGQVVFHDITGNQHTVTLDHDAVENLAAHSLTCSEPSQTIRLDDGTDILFCFTAKGFMEVDVSEEYEGN